MHADGPAVVLGCSRDQLRNDSADCRSMAGIVQHLKKVRSCLYHIVQHVFLEFDMDFQRRKSEFVLMVFRWSDIVFFLWNHHAENLHSKLFRFLPKPALDLAYCSERTNSP